ncbi:MAG: PDZ domain-containing protein [Rubrivivax sp.]|nr:PDZ domain-containing protein [Rubrivivax sp.]
MPAVRHLLTRATLALVALAPVPCAAEPGFLGIGISIDGEGYVANRIVKAVRIQRVVPYSPAAQAGLRPDDEIVEVDGQPVRGKRISELRPLLDRQEGHALQMLVKKPGGELVSVRPVLAARPPPP